MNGSSELEGKVMCVVFKMEVLTTHLVYFYLYIWFMLSLNLYWDSVAAATLIV